MGSQLGDHARYEHPSPCHRYFKYQGALLLLQNLMTAVTALLPLILITLIGSPEDNDLGSEADDDRYKKLLQLNVQLTYAFGASLQLPIMYSKLGGIAGACHRVGHLLEVLDDIQRPLPLVPELLINGKVNRISLDIVDKVSVNSFADDSTTSVTMQPAMADAPHALACPTTDVPDCIELLSVTVRTPGIGGKILFYELDLHVPVGQSLVVMGPSGCGKSSLLRVIAGLWPVVAGSIRRPLCIGRGGVFFVPQRPYIFCCTLREQILYPCTLSGPHQSHSHSSPEESKKILALLQFVGLEHLSAEWGLDTEFKWDTLLSVGEKQRLGFARLFYHEPKFVLMDEATSALDVAMEERCLGECRRLGVTMVSVAHRPTVVHHHQRLLAYNSKTKDSYLSPYPWPHPHPHLSFYPYVHRCQVLCLRTRWLLTPEFWI